MSPAADLPPRLRVPGSNLLRGFAPQAVTAVLLAAATASGQQAAFRPELVEAELVERFTQFIDWPEDRLAAPEDPFILGLIGRDGVGPALEKLARARGLKKHRVEIVLLDGPEGVERCHAVWIDTAANDQLGAVLARTSGKPILTLGDTEGFAARGVLINLRREATRISFEINLGAVRRSGLKFSSRLLALGKIVETREPP